MMIVFEKGEPIRCIGHLDLMRAMQRALRRSGLPVKYSSGFNPHIRLSFAAPLSVGIVGMRELMEAPVEGEVAESDFLAGLNAVLPTCLLAKRCRRLDDKFPTLMSLVAGSRYTIRFGRSAASDAAAARLGDFMALKEYVADRRTKSGENPCDIRPFVRSATLAKEGEQRVIRLETVCTAAGALKPTLWMDSLRAFAGADEFHYMVYREAILARDGKGKLMPMEDLP